MLSRDFHSRGTGRRPRRFSSHRVGRGPQPVDASAHAPTQRQARQRSTRWACGQPSAAQHSALRGRLCGPRPPTTRESLRSRPSAERATQLTTRLTDRPMSHERRGRRCAPKPLHRPAHASAQRFQTPHYGRHGSPHPPNDRARPRQLAQEAQRVPREAAHARVLRATNGDLLLHHRQAGVLHLYAQHPQRERALRLRAQQRVLPPVLLHAAAVRHVDSR